MVATWPQSLLAVLLLAILARPTQAFNAIGHRVIAAVAWQEMSPATREYVAAVLRRHPRFDEDFAKQMPEGVADEDGWIFQQAAVWPDMARGFPGEARKLYAHSTWHYVNHPIFHGEQLPLFKVNLSTDYPPREAVDEWNVCQAVKHCQAALNSKAPPHNKALALCWLAHLIGDLHQPMHSSALFSDRFPTGDRGGNTIDTIQGDNLHSLWDNLLGRSHKPNDVKREVAELRARPRLFAVDMNDGPEAWILESHELAKGFAYSPEILKAVEARGELPPVNLSFEYLQRAGELARERVAAAGVRLAAVINDLPISDVPAPKSKPAARPVPAASLVPDNGGIPGDEEVLSRTRARAPSRQPKPATVALDHWLNTKGNIRHNSSCRWYHNTKSGRKCTADEGRACGQCGG